MKISDSFRKLIIDEVRFSVEKMEEKEDLREKLYYFSGIQCVLRRVFNIEFDPDLLFAFNVFESTHRSFMDRYGAIEKGGDRVVLIFQEQLDGLTEGAKEFADKIKNKKNFDSTLKKLIVLSYTTTGNGYYLLQKGLIRF